MRVLSLLVLCGALFMGCSSSTPVFFTDGAAPPDVAVVWDWPPTPDLGPDLAPRDMADDTLVDAPIPDVTPDQIPPDILAPDLVPPDTGAPWIDRCQQAKMLKLTAGKVTTTGDTTGLSNEFTSVKCGGLVAFTGPQAYYTVYLDGAQVYEVTLSPKFNAYYYIFSPAAFCQEKDIEKDCSSGGSTGDVSLLVKSGATQTITFKVPKSGYYYVGVDSSGPNDKGSFTLSIALECSAYTNKCNTGVNVNGVCAAQPKTGSCTDEDPCTLNDQCVTDSSGLGVCKGTAKVCPGNSCNTGKCDNTSGVCVTVPKTGTCDDGDKCTTGDTCQNGVCKGTTTDCSAKTDICNTGLCNQNDGLCIAVPKSGTIYCSDGDSCTTTDICVGGVCKGTAKVCPGDQCNSGSCDKTTGFCTKAYKTGTCTDNDKCTEGDNCSKQSTGVGICKGTAKSCGGDQCNTSVCDPTTGNCKKTYKAGTCFDGELCTYNDTCVKQTDGSGKCVGTKKVCSGDQCNNAACNTSTGLCERTYNAGFCADGNNCTVSDTCVKQSDGSGKCVGTAKSCAGDQCNTGSCDATSGSCMKVFKTGLCYDGDNCTKNDTCLKQNDGSGKCVGTTLSCAGDQCNTGYCDSSSGACKKAYKLGYCSDGNNCTVSDTCYKLSSGEGACSGTAKVCSGDQCNSGYCDASSGACKKAYKVGTCTDSNKCTYGDTCYKQPDNTGACKGTATSCAGDQCNTGYCNTSTGGCAKAYKAGSCSDGNSCTSGDVCYSSSGIGYCKSGSWPLDGWESNNSCSTNKNLGSVSEDAWKSTTGSISPPSDADWFRFQGLESYHACWPGSSQTYYLRVQVVVPAGRTYRVCVYRDSCSGASSCSTGTGTMTVQRSVGGKCGSNDNKWGYVLIYATDGKQQCQGYTLSYNYHD